MVILVLASVVLAGCIGPSSPPVVAPSPTTTAPSPIATSPSPPLRSPSPLPSSPSPAATPSSPVLLAAGDIASCSQDGHRKTAEILDQHPEATVATLGDNAYNSGNARQFACYDETWGRAKERTRPTLGGHDYMTPQAAGYFDYFGDVLEPFGETATDPDRGYYSYNVGEWHVVVLNSICEEVLGGCEPASEQADWLRQDLAANGADCTFAAIHHPRFSSGRKGEEDSVEPFWDVLYEHGVEFVLSGDNHAYERLAPTTPTGELDPAGGIRQFVVGTGGRSHYPFSDGPIQPHSESRNDDTFGVLKLTLHPDRYEWDFLPEEGKTFTDAGSEGCH